MAQMTKADALLRLVVESLRIGPKLQLQGDHLAEEFGLTSSRWTFLSYVDNADRPLSVADLARRMDLKPQTVQRFADACEDNGFVTWADNPDHKRARLISLTPKGKKALQTLRNRERDWTATVADGLTTQDILKAVDVLATFRENITR